jgi:hypothetical protein
MFEKKVDENKTLSNGELGVPNVMLPESPSKEFNTK